MVANFPRWSDEKVQRAVELFKSGLSSGRVATIMDVSRNAVIGIMSRKGHVISKLNGIRNGEHRKRPRLHSDKSHAISVKTRGNLPPLLNSKTQPLPDMPHEAPTGHSCTIIDLNDHHCHWPLWGEADEQPKLYCGAPSNGRVYCPYHTMVSAAGYYRTGIALGNEVAPGKVAKING